MESDDSSNEKKGDTRTIVFCRTMYYSVSDTGILGKRKSKCSYQDLPITSSDVTDKAVQLVTFIRLKKDSFHISRLMKIACRVET